VGALGNTSSEGSVRLGGATARWRKELGPVVLDSADLATVASGDGLGSLQHQGVK
jgi:hypothetical protein